MWGGVANLDLPHTSKHHLEFVRDQLAIAQL